jgi:hypothetical protein
LQDRFGKPQFAKVLHIGRKDTKKSRNKGYRSELFRTFAVK